MKTIPVSLFVAAMIAPVVVIAEPEGGSPPVGGEARRGPQPFMEGWKAADTNADGAISKEEFESMQRIQNLPAEKRMMIFNRLDKNADGKLGREELGHIGKSHDGQAPMQRLWELDADKSGGVSLEEFQAGEFFKKLDPERQKVVFRRLDTNGDGVISPKDKPEPPFRRDGGKMHPKRPDGNKPEMDKMDVQALIRRLDQNGDGALSFEEFRAAPALKDLSEDEQENRFDALDKNHDLKLDAGDAPASPPRGGQKAPPAESAQ